MNFNFKGYVVDYDYIFNDARETILFLHGWGGNKNSFISLIRMLKNKYNILTISMPPYFLDKSKFDSVLPLDMFDYANLIMSILKLHNIENVSIICHSFGFRVTLILSSLIKIKCIIVTGGAGINMKKNIFKRLDLNRKIIEYKTSKIINKSSDYIGLNDVDKKTFQNVTKRDLKGYVQFIDCPVLLFWGKKDTETSVKICYYLKKKIKNSTQILVDSDHFAYINESALFCHSTMQFLTKNLES